METEILDIVDENGEPTGRRTERRTAHREGIRHRTAHLWIVREKDKEKEVLIQKRSKNKDSYPGFYDISSAGHIPAGETWLKSAIRELSEELGITATENELIYCGIRHIHTENIFHREKFIDNQVSRVYILKRDIKESDITVQKEEIESVHFIRLNELYESVRLGTIKSCIRLEELDMIKAAL